MGHHLSYRYCPQCDGILDGTRVGEEEYCGACDGWFVGYEKGFVARCRAGHEVTQDRKKVGKILYAWCDEEGEWVRLTYVRPESSSKSRPATELLF